MDPGTTTMEEDFLSETNPELIENFEDAERTFFSEHTEGMDASILERASTENSSTSNSEESDIEEETGP